MTTQVTFWDGHVEVFKNETRRYTTPDLNIWDVRVKDTTNLFGGKTEYTTGKFRDAGDDREDPRLGTADAGFEVTSKLHHTFENDYLVRKIERL